MDTKKVVKTALSYTSGYAGLKAGAETMRDAGRIPLSGIQYVAKSVKEMQEEARLDRELARTMDGKELWKKMVADYGVTTDTVRGRYKVVLAVNYFLLGVIALFVGYWVGLEHTSFTINAACGVYLWMLFLFLFYNAYRGHIAYSQCVTNPFAFLGLIIKNPLNLIVKSLPENYKVGEA